MFSRWMPPYQQAETGAPSRALLAVLLPLAAWSTWYLAHHPVGIIIGGSFVAFVARVDRVLDWRLERRTRARAGEDIGTFARAFDRRAPGFDPWVVRAVWDALATWTVLRNGSRFPLRPGDVIAELGCADEDLDDVFEEAATRARRRRDASAANPYRRPVTTVGDLVAFIAHQPREEAA